MPRKKEAKKPVLKSPENKKSAGKNNVASVLILLSVIFLVASGVGIIFWRDVFASVFYQEKGLSVSLSYFTVSGIIWIVLAGAIMLTKKKIEKQKDATHRWFLLALGVITMMSGSIVAGLLTLIAAILYLREGRE